MLLMVVVPLLLGCQVVDAILGIERPEDVKAGKEFAQNQVRAAELQQGVDRAPGNYRLTFTGEAPGPWGSFDPINRTPAMLTDAAFTASEINEFTSGDDPKTAVQAKDTWKIEATRSGNRIEGTAKFVRWIAEHTIVKITDADTGEVRYESAAPGDYPAVTVTWDGTLKAVVSADGTIAGTVEGTMTNNEGFSAPFRWEFTGDSAE